jgi:hypothetical protein
LARRAAAGPDHQLGREDDAAVLVLGRPVGLVEQEFGRRASELVLGLADRRERHGRVRGELDVVVADDREISRDAHARLAQPEQVGHRDLAAAPVIHGDRALSGRTRPVEQDHRGAAVTDPPQLG